jgi:hypothetical protein
VKAPLLDGSGWCLPRLVFADHAPAHFHAIYAGEEAVIAIATGEVLAARCLIGRCGWCENGCRSIATSWQPNWERTQVPEQPAPIAPLP